MKMAHDGEKCGCGGEFFTFAGGKLICKACKRPWSAPEAKPAPQAANRADTRADVGKRQDSNHGASMTAKRRVGGKLNKTESRFLREVLMPKIAAGELLHVFPQSFHMDFGDGTSYRPDFLCFTIGGGIILKEVKGGHVGKAAWSRLGLERFRRAREKWPSLKFELWQSQKGGGWKLEG